jgi:hypothetical protein
MRILALRLTAVLYLALAAASAQAPSKATSAGTASATPQPPGALSQRVVAYTIEARYDAKTHVLEGTETLRYHNLTGQPLDRFPFHLYLNAFQPQSTFVREAHRERSDAWEEKKRGSIEIERFESQGQNLTAQLHFIQPDDGNADDRTVTEVKLPHAVAAGDTVEFKISFRDKFPEVVARTGYYRDFIMGAQWFPKVGVFWHGAWNCHQFHDTTEFFADFGTFDVKLTLPENEVVGGTGVQIGEQKNAGGNKTVTFHAEDVHDFAWTASPDFKVFEDTFQGSAGPVKLRLLMQPARAYQSRRTSKILTQSMELFDKWYGPYPYPQLTYVDPAKSEAGGMEYPTLITGDGFWGAPEHLYIAPEVVAEHEFGHQYWYGMVATNEFEEAWLDEGINSYTEAKVMDALYGPDNSILQFGATTLGERGLQRFQYVTAADLDPMTRHAWEFASFNSYGGITYGKTASVFLTLESVIGEETMQRAVRTWFQRYRFQHPSGEDFLKTVEEVSGRDLKWYFNQAVRGTAILDFEILSVKSSAQDWYAEKPATPETYVSEFMVHRKGDFIMPVEIEVKFSDGTSKRETWDGVDRWKRYSYLGKAKIESVEADPGHKLLLDRQLFDNSHTVKSQSSARHKLANYWTFAVEMLQQLAAWLA